VGALSEYLISMITARLQPLRRRSYAIIRKIPRYGRKLYDFIYKQEARVKGFFVPGSFFEELGIRYFGPSTATTCPAHRGAQGVKDINNGPKIVHVITERARLRPAEKDPAAFTVSAPSTGTPEEPAADSIAYSE
jgi:1-deoxy-D-xylulose-5-phosphate synthase